MIRTFCKWVWLVTLGVLFFIFLSEKYVLAMVSPNAEHYLSDALLDGKYVQRWNDQTRPVYVTIYSGKHIPGWNPAMIQAVKVSLLEWQKAIGGRVTFYFTDNPSLTDIRVTWRKHPEGYRIGHQNMVWQNNVLVDAEIQIAVYNTSGQPFTSDEMKNIALHEIGHALGIRGHSANPNDIMYPSIRGNVIKPSARDIKTVLELYKRPPQITNPVGAHLGLYRRYHEFIRAGMESNLKQDHQAAYSNFKKALSANPADSNTQFLVGLSAYNLKKYDEAMRYFNKLSSSRSPYQAHATFYMAQSLLLTGNQMVISGDKRNGLNRIQQADMYFAKALQNNMLPESLRKIAMSQRTMIKNRYQMATGKK